MTPAEAAKWMLKRAEQDRGVLYQETAAAHLLEQSDEKLAYWDASGTACLGKEVLAAFRKLTPNHVYERAGKFWRPREDHDLPGRQQ
jgi:Family of unknown function (DUF6953)